MARKPRFNQLLRFSYICCRRQREKRAKNGRNDKGTSQSSNQELNNEDTVIITASSQALEFTEETIPNIQELNLRETSLSDQQLENNEVISRDDELNMNSETSQRDEEINETTANSSKQVLEDL